MGSGTIPTLPVNQVLVRKAQATKRMSHCFLADGHIQKKSPVVRVSAMQFDLAEFHLQQRKYEHSMSGDLEVLSCSEIADIVLDNIDQFLDRHQ